MTDILDNLREAIEGLKPDHRKFFRPTVEGIVEAVHDDADDDYYKVDVTIGKTDTDPGVTLPYVEVSSLWSQNGYGVFALPETGAKVNVGFHDAELSKPFIIMSMWDENNSVPQGFVAGTFAIRGKQGQRIEVKAGTNEVVIAAESVKTIAAVKQEQVVGNQSFDFHGDRKTVVDGADSIDADRIDIKTWRDATIEIGQVGRTDQPGRASSGANLNLTILGNETHSAGGSLAITSGGGFAMSSAAGMSVSSIFSRNDMVGGKYSMICLGGSGNPATPAYSVFAPLGIQLSASLLPIPKELNLSLPGAVVIGSPAPAPTEMILLGGPQALAQPAVCSLSLIAWLTNLVTKLATVPIAIGNLGAPTLPNPVFATAMADLLATMPTFQSTKVFISQV